jgi:F0F1-type ATP synthase gamma subunit
MSQEVKSIELSSAVSDIGSKTEDTSEIISETNYIFEPSTYDVVDHLERSMMQIALSQLILNSKLAQYASRFRAMSASHQRADEAKQDLRTEFNRSKRNIKDARLKEIINGLKKVKAGVPS